jgi:hypothetical protein
MPNRSQAPVQALALKAETISRQEIQDVFTKLATCGHHTVPLSEFLYTSRTKAVRIGISGFGPKNHLGSVNVRVASTRMRR